MTLDYKKLGFKCGIEIHQQLDTGKLFCRCPSIVHDSNPDISVMRKLRASAGETGDIDAAAKYEHEKDRYIIYEGCSTSSCLVELDEEPPHEIEKEALNISLKIAKMLNCNAIEFVQFMRKTVIDGSNTSGFQRTALIATEGSIKTSKGDIGIQTVCLEEEAAKKIEENKGFIKFRLDRLGVPLVEIATEPIAKDPEHVKEIAQEIGKILRSTNVKRGIGTIRQDINISIKGHPRVEIKGFQDLKSIPKVVENEVKRQISNLQKKKNLASEVRQVSSDGTSKYLRPMPGAARMYPETDVPVIKITKKMISELEIPELLSEREEKIIKFGLPKEIAAKIAKNSDKESMFFKYAEKIKNIKPSFIAESLLTYPKEDLIPVLDSLSLGNINSSSIAKKILTERKEGKIKNIKEALKNIKNFDDSELEKEIKKIINDNKGAPIGAIMGLVMKKFKGSVEGKKVMEIVKKNME